MRQSGMLGVEYNNSGSSQMLWHEFIHAIFFLSGMRAMAYFKYAWTQKSLRCVSETVTAIDTKFGKMLLDIRMARIL